MIQKFQSPKQDFSLRFNIFSGNQLQKILTGPLIGATLSLPNALATSLLQQHVTAALRGQQTGNLLATNTFVVSIIQKSITKFYLGNI